MAFAHVDDSVRLFGVESEHRAHLPTFIARSVARRRERGGENAARGSSSSMSCCASAVSIRETK